MTEPGGMGYQKTGRWALTDERECENERKNCDGQKCSGTWAELKETHPSRKRSKNVRMLYFCFSKVKHWDFKQSVSSQKWSQL